EALGELQLGAVGREGQLLGERRQVVLPLEDLQVRDQGGALPHQVIAAPQPVAGLAPTLGVDVSEREVAAAQQAGALVGGDLGVLGLSPVAELQVQGVSEYERELRTLAQVRQPVPGIHALDADPNVVAERGGGFEEGLGPGGEVLVEDDGAGVAKDAQVQGPGMEVEAAVESAAWPLARPPH